MIEELLHNRSDAGGSQFISTDKHGGRDGRNKLRPSRLAHAARRGVTLVELMIAMLILAIVCIAWLKIIGIQSARKEARRREAVERLAGMMDAFMYCNRNNNSGNVVPVVEGACYEMAMNGDVSMLTFKKDDGIHVVHPVFDDSESPVGYQLSVVAKRDLPHQEKFKYWNEDSLWLVGRLYNRTGTLDEAGRPFFTLPVCLVCDSFVLGL